MSSPQPPGTPRMNWQEPIPNATLLVERYRIERVIGEGAYGRVYLARDTRLQRSVAIKELLASRAQSDPASYAQYLARFEREARATGVVQQPNVVTVYDQHVDDAGNNYLVMEYVDGTSLRDLLAQVGTLPVNRAVAITTDIARALEAVHERGIVHRDVKPANIIISRRGVAKLTDFGIALVAGEQQLTAMAGGHPGTQAYMSPEQATGYGPLDGRSDLYSLGLVLYEMLAGEAYARRRQPLRSVRPDLPPMLLAVADKLMAPAAEARYQSAFDLLTDLQALPLGASASSQPMTSAPPGMAPPGTYVSGGAPVSYGVPNPGSVPPSMPPGMLPDPEPAMAPSPGYPRDTAQIPAAYGIAQPPYGGTPGGPYGGAPQPQPKSNRGVIFGIVGAVVAAVAAVALVFVFTHRGDNTPATATPNVGAATPTTRVTTVANTTTTPSATSDSGVVLTTPTRSPTIAVVSPTPLASPTTARTPTSPATSTPATSATPTRPATSPTTGPVALTDTWTDTDGLIAMKFPGGWTKGKDSSDSTNVVEFSSTNGPFVDVFVDDPQQGSIADEVKIITDNQAKSQKFTYTNQTTQDLTMGGEPAKILTFTYTDKTDATRVFQGGWWIVNHDGRQYSIAASPIGSSRATVDAMVASVSFPAAKVTTWLDPDKVIRTRYPNDWSASNDKDNALILNGANDEIHIFVSIFNPGSTTIDQEFKSIRDGGSDDGKTVRTYDPVVDTKVGGQAAKSMAYKYTAKANTGGPSGTATIWIVDYKGKRYEFFCSNMSLHRQEIEAFMNSVTFLK